jgi:hypothetical protein
LAVVTARQKQRKTLVMRQRRKPTSAVLQRGRQQSAKRKSPLERERKCFKLFRALIPS